MAKSSSSSSLSVSEKVEKKRQKDAHAVPFSSFFFLIFFLNFRHVFLVWTFIYKSKLLLVTYFTWDRLVVVEVRLVKMQPWLFILGKFEKKNPPINSNRLVYLLTRNIFIQKKSQAIFHLFFLQTHSKLWLGSWNLSDYISWH